MGMQNFYNCECSEAGKMSPSLRDNTYPVYLPLDSRNVKRTNKQTNK